MDGRTFSTITESCNLALTLTVTHYYASEFGQFGVFGTKLLLKSRMLPEIRWPLALQNNRLEGSNMNTEPEIYAHKAF